MTVEIDLEQLERSTDHEHITLAMGHRYVCPTVLKAATAYLALCRAVERGEIKIMPADDKFGCAPPSEYLPRGKHP